MCDLYSTFVLRFCLMLLVNKAFFINNCLWELQLSSISTSLSIGIVLLLHNWKCDPTERFGLMLLINKASFINIFFFNQVTEWLSVVEECKINYSTKSIVDSLSDINLERDHVLVSFDVSSLYTNVPVYEAMEECTNLLYSCLLYTSPSPRDATLSRMPSSA